jgi:hypothetical protein
MIKYSGAASGWNDVPAGAYRVPNSSVLVSGHQKGGIGFLFGAVGVIAQSAVDSNIGKGAVGTAQDALQIDASALAAEVTQKVLGSASFSRRFALSTSADRAALSVTPYIALTFVSDTEVRPYVVLKATQDAGLSGGAARTTRYFCCEGPPAPLAGDNGLTANNGEALKKLLASEMEVAVNVLLSDVASPYSRDDKTLYVAEGSFPFSRTKFPASGYKLGRYQDYLLFLTKANSMAPFAGIHIMDESGFTVTPPKASK